MCVGYMQIIHCLHKELEHLTVLVFLVLFSFTASENSYYFTESQTLSQRGFSAVFQAFFLTMSTTEKEFTLCEIHPVIRKLLF